MKETGIVQATLKVRAQIEIDHEPVKISLILNLQKSTKCIQTKKVSPFQTDEIWHDFSVLCNNISFLASRLASEKKQTVLGQRNKVSHTCR